MPVEFVVKRQTINVESLNLKVKSGDAEIPVNGMIPRGARFSLGGPSGELKDLPSGDKDRVRPLLATDCIVLASNKAAVENIDRRVKEDDAKAARAKKLTPAGVQIDLKGLAEMLKTLGLVVPAKV